MEVVHFCLTILIFIHSRSTTADQHKIKVVSGLHVKEVESVLAYEDEVPLNLAIPLPQLNDALTPFQNCAGGSEYLCNLALASHDTYTRLRQSLVGSPVFAGSSNSSAKRGLLNFVGELHGFLYGVETERHALLIQKDVQSLAEHEKFLSEKVSADHKGLVAVVQNITMYSSKMQAYLSALRQSMNDSLRAAYKSHLKNEAILAYTVSEQMHYMYLSLMKVQMDLATLSCSNRMIPSSVVDHNVLAEELSKLQKRVNVLGYVIATEMSRVVSLPIASCTFTKDYLYVSLRVPVKRSTTELKVIQLTPILFQHGADQCIIKDATNHAVVSSDGVYPVVPSLHSSCDVSRLLCKVPNLVHQTGTFASCVEAVLQEHTADDIIMACQLECRRTGRKFKTFIEEGKLAFTNYRQISVKCPNETNVIRNITASLGAIVVNQPCGCTILADDELIPTRMPCIVKDVEEHAFHQAIPAAWAKLTSVIISEDVSYRNATEAMNFLWKLTIPFLNATPPLELTEQVLTTSFPIVGTMEFSNEFLICWVTMLTCCVFFLIFSFFFTRCRSGLSVNAAKYIPFVPGVMGEDDAAVGKTWMTFVWDMLLKMEWIEVGGFICVILLFTLVLILSFRILRYVRNTAAYVSSSFALPEFEDRRIVGPNRLRGRNGSAY